MSKGSVSEGIGNPFLGPVALPDQAQSGECEEVVDVVYLVAEGCDRRRQAASRDRGRLDAKLLADAAEDAVDLTGEAVDDSRSQRSLCVPADRGGRSLDLDLDQLRGPLREGIHRDLHTGRDRSAEVLALSGYDVVVDAGPEIHNHTRALDLVVGRNGVHQAVGPDLARVVRADRRAKLYPWCHEQEAPVEVALVEPDPLLVLLRDDRGDDRAVDVVHAHSPQAQEGRDADGELVRGRRSRSREAEVVDELVATEHPEMGLRISYVDRQEHWLTGLSAGARPAEPSRPRTPARAPRDPADPAPAAARERTGARASPDAAARGRRGLTPP